MAHSLDKTDRAIVNALQGGFPICERPYAEAASKLGIAEEDLIGRIGRLVESDTLSRFGPMYNAERLGGAVTLAAMAVPEERFEEVAAIVNAHAEVAHNYRREHELNMWFVVASEDPEETGPVLSRIAAETGLEVHDFPKLDEFFVGLRVEA
jgi:DNA-binding Lrp family transcriptional regulator